MIFRNFDYAKFVSEDTSAPERLLVQYMGASDDFNVVIIGSGMREGILADEMADRIGGHKPILVLEVGSFLYPTHVSKVCRFPNGGLARHFGSDTFWQDDDSNSKTVGVAILCK
jgi:hypothetical protein